MKSFKDFVNEDIKSIFINPSEFGKLKIIDGVELMVVIDNDVINERPRLLSSSTDLYAQGVYQSTVTFFIQKEDLGYTPVKDQLMKFDDKPYIVSNVVESLGMFEITIEANES